MVPIIVGHTGETGSRQHVFPIGNLIAKYPNCQPFVMHQRAGDTVASPVANTIIDGGRLVWIFDAVDTAYSGDGWCWLIMVSPDGETVWMTDKQKTIIKDGCIDFDSEEPISHWIQTLLATAAEIKEIKQQVDASAQAAAQSAQAAHTAADSIGDAVVRAEKAADSAGIRAYDTENWSTVAKRSAIDAQNARSSAITSASNANQAAISAEKAQTEAEKARDEAHSSAEAAAQSAEDAARSADAAKEARDDVQEMMDEIDALTSEVSAISNNINSPDGFLANAKPLIIGNAKRWQGTTKGTHVVLNIKGGDIITITASNINRAIYAVLKNYKPIVDKAVDFSEADGFTDRILQDKGTEKTFTIPADGNYLCVNLNYETSIYTPSKIKINGVEITYGVRKVVDELQQNVVDINAAMNKDFFITKPNLPSATNLDDIRETGYYNLATNGTFVNAPAKITRAFLCVFATSASVPRQLLCDLSNGCLYIRYRADGVWTEWQEIISLHQLKLNLSRNEKRKAVDHGGIYSNRAYENSPKAFYDAYKEGIVYHNVDIVFSSDGVPFVFHDNQTTDIAGTAFKFSDLTAAQIRMHKVGDNDYSWIPQELAEVDKHIKALGGSIEMIDVTAPNTQASIANAGNLPNYYRINNIKPAWTNYDYSSMRDAFISNGNQFGVYIVINSESEMQAAIEYIRSRSGIKFAVNIAYDACIGFIHNYIGELAGLGVAIYTGAFGGVESIRDADIQWADGILSERCNANYAEYMYYAKP